MRIAAIAAFVLMAAMAMMFFRARPTLSRAPAAMLRPPTVSSRLVGAKSISVPNCRGLQRPSTGLMTTSTRKDAVRPLVVQSGNAASANSIYEFDANLIDGRVLPLSEFKGKVVLIENVATL